MTQAALIQEIRQLHRADQPLNITAVRKNHPALLAAAYAFTPFLGWKQALDLAGIDYHSIRVELEAEIECRVCGSFFRTLNSHVINIHGYETSSEYEHEFPGAPMLSEQVLANCRTATATIPHWEPLCTWQYILDRTWHWHHTQGQCNNDFVRKNDRSVFDYADRLGMTWDDVICAIGLNPEVERHVPGKLCHLSPEEILSILERRACSGLSLKYKELNHDHPGIYLAIVSNFGGLTQAFALAGIGSELHSRTLSDKFVYLDIAAINAGLRAHVIAGHELTQRSVRLINAPLLRAILGRFPSLPACLAATGLAAEFPAACAILPRRTGPRSGYKIAKYPDAAAVVAALKARHRAGLSLSQNQSLLDDSTLKSAVYTHFVSWKEAIATAGLNKAHQRQLAAHIRKDTIYKTQAAAIEALQARHHLGKRISQDAVSADDGPLKSAAYRLFGSWIAFVAAAGLTTAAKAAIMLANQQRRDRHYPTKESVIVAIQQRHAAGGSLHREEAIHFNYSLRLALAKFFKNWRELLAAAGLLPQYLQDYPKMRDPYPDRASVLTAIRQRHRLGQSLSIVLIQKDDMKLKTSIYKLFGSITLATELALSHSDTSTKNSTD
jgi:hypothetical protein